MNRYVVAAALAFSVVVGCSTSGERTLTGTITQMDEQRLCVSAHAATGDCFAALGTRDKAGLYVGECVRVRYREDRAVEPGRRVLSIRAEREPDDKGDCVEG